MKRIAFFGGSFDPPHRGHLAIAKAAADHFALDEVLFAPVASQPLKDRQTVTPFLHRYAMTALATGADPRFIPSLLDAPLDPPADRANYTVETLERLRSSLDAETSIFALLGADSWLEISHWHDAARLLSLTDWIVAARPGFSLANAERALPPGVRAKQIQDSPEHSLELHHLNGMTTRVFSLPEIQEEASATKLRETLGPGQFDPEWLASAVLEYIRKTGLYRDKAVPGRIR
jgi:nicotinate-nucleotide adenylyltransferase